MFERCRSCRSAEMITRKLEYKGHDLTVAVCRVCESLDFEVPDQLEDEFDELCEWVKDEAEKILKEEGLWFKFFFSSLVEEEVRSRIKDKLIELCEAAGFRIAYVGKRHDGLNITLRRGGRPKIG